MKCYLEHANITIEDIDKTVRFLVTAFPHFEVRGKGESETDGVIRKWLHIGTDKTYIALEQISSEKTGSRTPYQDTGINHIGFVVDDLDPLTTRLKNEGYTESISVEPHSHRKRAYFYDGDSIEYEFIEYLSDNFAERNEYD